jgi:glutamyl-tRNA reductase
LASLRLAGISFQSLPVALREEFALTNDKKENAPILLKAVFGLSEIVCLYTCNRIEYYYTADIEVDPYELFCYFCPNDIEFSQKIRGNIYCYSDEKVCDHLFKVICGLKSMVIGETQILNQIKKAFQISSRNGCVHKNLNNLFQFAFKTAKEIHRLTSLDSIKSSISSLSVELAENLLGSLSEAKILIIGTGETAELTQKTLTYKGINNFLFMSKSEQRALEWAIQSGVPTLVIEELPLLINKFDVIIACTDCQEPLLKKEFFLNNHFNFQQKKIVLIDLGVPRNIDSSIAELENIHLRNIDDLKGMMDGNHEFRMREMSLAASIIEDAVEKYKCRQSLSIMFQDIHENVQSEAKNNLIEIINQFQNSGDLEGLQEKLALLIARCIESPLDGFRSLANKIPSAVLNEYAFSSNQIVAKQAPIKVFVKV